MACFRNGQPVDAGGGGGGGGPVFGFYNAVYESGAFNTLSATYVQVTGSTLTLTGANLYMFHWQAELTNSAASTDFQYCSCIDVTNTIEIGEGMVIKDFGQDDYDIRSGFKQIQQTGDATYEIQAKVGTDGGTTTIRKCRMWAMQIG